MSRLVLPRPESGVPRRMALRGEAGDRWFSALDGAWIAIGPNDHQIAVLGVHLSEHHIWIQVAVEDQPDCSFVIRVDDATTFDLVKHALGALPDVPQPLTVVDATELRS